MKEVSILGFFFLKNSQYLQQKIQEILPQKALDIFPYYNNLINTGLLKIFLFLVILFKQIFTSISFVSCVMIIIDAVLFL